MDFQAPERVLPLLWDLGISLAESGSANASLEHTMHLDPLGMMLFLDGALGIITIASLAYVIGGRRPELRFTLVVSLLLLAALFAFLPFIPAFQPEAVGISKGKVLL